MDTASSARAEAIKNLSIVSKLGKYNYHECTGIMVVVIRKTCVWGFSTTPGLEIF